MVSKEKYFFFKKTKKKRVSDEIKHLHEQECLLSAAVLYMTFLLCDSVGDSCQFRYRVCERVEKVEQTL